MRENLINDIIYIRTLLATNEESYEEMCTFNRIRKDERNGMIDLLK